MTYESDIPATSRAQLSVHPLSIQGMLLPKRHRPVGDIGGKAEEQEVKRKKLYMGGVPLPQYQ